MRKLQAENSNGLFDVRPRLSIEEYRENFGFDLKNGWDIFQSKKLHHSGEDWYRYPKSSTSLEALFIVQDKPNTDTDSMVVFVVESIKNHNVYCQLILSDKAYQKMLADPVTRVVKVEQFYLNVLQKQFYA